MSSTEHESAPAETRSDVDGVHGPAAPTCWFNVEHRPDGENFHLVYIPAIDRYTQARDFDEMPYMAKDLIALVTGIPIENIAVMEYYAHKGYPR